MSHSRVGKRLPEVEKEKVLFAQSTTEQQI